MGPPSSSSRPGVGLVAGMDEQGRRQQQVVRVPQQIVLTFYNALLIILLVITVVAMIAQNLTGISVAALFDVAPQCFDPPPAVMSAVVRLTPLGSATSGRPTTFATR